MTAVILTVISILSMNTRSMTYRKRLGSLQAIVGLTVTAISYVIYYLVADRKTILETALIVCCAAFVFGAILCRIMVLLILLNQCAVKLETSEVFKQVLVALFMPWSFEFTEMMTYQISISTDDENK
jgi:hypothetical protein